MEQTHTHLPIYHPPIYIGRHKNIYISKCYRQDLCAVYKRRILLSCRYPYRIIRFASDIYDKYLWGNVKVYLPTTIISPWSETVWKEGASPDTSHRKRPLVDKLTFSRTTVESVELWSCVRAFGNHKKSFLNCSSTNAAYSFRMHFISFILDIFHRMISREMRE